MSGRNPSDDRLLVRVAAQDDLPQLLELFRHLDPSETPMAPERARYVWDRIEAAGNVHILIGLLKARLVTTCTLVVVPNLTRGGTPYALIENVVTDAACRKRGYGTAILRHAVARAWDEGCYKVMLLTGSKNPSTLRLYESVGFQQNKTGFQIRRATQD